MPAYLDNSATTRQIDEVTDVMTAAMKEEYGNPSSLHKMGVSAEKKVKNARERLAQLVGAAPHDIYFTSGGTESDNTSIFGAVESLKRQGNHVITTGIEHPAVLECYRRLAEQGMRVTYLGVDRNGFIDPDELEAAITDDTILVSVMHVNNETGAIQPVHEVGRIVDRSQRALFHCDAVQSFGKLPISVKDDRIDFLAASAHKIHGPKGMGLLYVRNGLHIPPYLYGGGQEKGMRSGTENVPGILGFAKATEIAGANMQKNMERVTQLRDYLLEGIQSEIPDVLVNSPVGEGLLDDAKSSCLPYVLNVSFLGTRGEVILHMLEQSEIYVSTGSACSSNKKGQSHVLAAMGLAPKEIEGALRFSFSPYNTFEELDYTLDRLKKAVADNRKMMGIAARMGR